MRSLLLGVPLHRQTVSGVLPSFQGLPHRVLKSEGLGGVQAAKEKWGRLNGAMGEERGGTISLRRSPPSAKSITMHS